MLKRKKRTVLSIFLCPQYFMCLLVFCVDFLLETISVHIIVQVCYTLLNCAICRMKVLSFLFSDLVHWFIGEEMHEKKALWILRRPITFCSSLSFYQFPTFRTRHLQRLCLFISSQTASNVRQAFEENAPKSEKEIENENKNISAHFTFHLFIWKMSTKMIADSH